MKSLTLTFTILVLIALIAIVLLVRRPEPIKQAIIKQFDLRPNIILDGDVASIEGNFDYKVYELSVPDANPSKIIIDIPGGAFISALPTFVAYKQMKLPCNVISFEYPTLFMHRANDSITYLEKTINKVLASRPEIKTVYLIGTSAGAYYAVKILNRGKVYNVKKFIGICGYYGHKTIPKNLTLGLLEHLYLTSFRNTAAYDCHIIANPIESMFITATKDFLIKSTENFATQNHLHFDTYEGNHLFFQMPETEGAKQAYSKVVNFLRKN